MRMLALGLAAATMLGATVASAQSVRVGPNGVEFGRDRDRDTREEYRPRRDRDREITTNTVGRDCRTVTVREEDENGYAVTRRERRCR